MPKARGMEAVLEKAGSAGKKRPMFAKKGAKKGKGPGVAIMIAMGPPRKGPLPRPMEDDEEEGEKMGGDGMSAYAEIARLKAKIAQLKEKLAQYVQGEEMDEEYDQAKEDEDEDEEEED